MAQSLSPGEERGADAEPLVIRLYDDGEDRCRTVALLTCGDEADPVLATLSDEQDRGAGETGAEVGGAERPAAAEGRVPECCKPRPVRVTGMVADHCG